MRMDWWAFVGVLSLGLGTAACTDTGGTLDPGDDDAGDDDAGDDDVPDDPCAYGATIFAEDVAHHIELTFSPADWAEIIEIGTDACEYCDDPRPYFPAAMVIDGEALAGDVGVRLKGHWSLMTADWENHIFPLKVDFNRYTDGQTYEGLKKLNLHQNREGLSSILEFVSYKAIRDHRVDGTTPVAAPRTSYTTLTVNGEELGLYSAVEQVSGSFLDCHFPEPRGHLYKPEEASEHLSLPYESYEEYPVLNFKWGPEELEDPEPPVDHSAVGHLINESHEGLAALEQVVDPDGVLLYHALNVGTGNHDYYGSYGHNYYLYEVTPGVFTMIVWDLNMALGLYEHPCGDDNEGKPLNEHLLRDEAYVDRYEVLLGDFLVHAMGTVPASLDDSVAILGDHVDGQELVWFGEGVVDEMGWMLDEVEAGIDICD